MRYFVILLTLYLVTNTVFASSYAQSDEFRFVNLNDSYLLGEEFSIVFQKITRQPCPSYDVVLMKEGIPESKITYGRQPMCALSGLVEPYLFSGTFEKLEFFDTIGTYSIKVMLDDKTIDKKITIINPEHYSFIPSPLKQIKSRIAIDEIQCRENLVLVQKYDGSPACVTEPTKEKLVGRGWTHAVSANLILHDGQSWGYIKDVLILGNGYAGITMSYPTNEAYHELYPDEYNSIVGNCDVQNDSANLSILYLNDIDSNVNTITFTKEEQIFAGMSCYDAFWDAMTQNGYCGPPPHLMSQRETLVSSITDAQNMVDFEFDVPKYLPEGYDVQKIRVDDDRKHVTLFISPFLVTNETDMCAFTWSDGGIYLSYASLPEGAPRFSNDPDREQITINGNRGYVEHRAIGDRAGTPIPQRSEITWHIPEGNLVLNMDSSLPAEELIKIAESIGELESKPNILLDIASIEENRIALNPTDTCAHISLRLLSADKLEQYQARDKEVQFFEITETDLEELPVLDELIQATHHLEFTTNDDARAEMGLRELVDYEFFIMEKSITKYNDSQDDYFLKLDGNLDEKLANPKPQGFSNEFLSPQIVYDDKVYVLSHTFFWVANEHETQHISVHLQDSLDNNKKFITLTDEDMESIPKIKQTIEKIGTEFESIHARKGLPEHPDWNEYREWFEQKKTEQINLDETYVPGFVYNDDYYDLGFPIC